MPDPDDNVRVRCVVCGQQYVTSFGSFNTRVCECPIRHCGSSKAQLLSGPEGWKDGKKK